MPVLMMDLPKVPEVRQALAAGDRILFYTDGVTERHDPADDMYDLPRLMSSLERSAARPPKSRCSRSSATSTRSAAIASPTTIRRCC